MDISDAHIDFCYQPPPQTVASHPRLVLGVPTFNEERFIGRTLRSIQAQTSEDFLAVISDNASTDGTGRICQEIEAQDRRFVYVRQPCNMGASNNFAFLLHATQSPLFAWIGSHDLLHPEYVQRHTSSLTSNPTACCSYTQFRIIDESDQVINDEGPRYTSPPDLGPMLRYLWTVLVGEEVAPVHGVFRRQVLRRIPLRSCLACDQVLLASCSLLGTMKVLPDNLYSIRDLDRSPRAQDRIERITGQPGAPTTFQSTVAGYLADFDLFHPPGSRARLCRPLVELILRDRFSGRSLRWTKLARSIAKRLRRAASGSSCVRARFAVA